jgi:hypothetical protein
MGKDALVELGAHTAALISRVMPEIDGKDNPDRDILGKLRAYVRATDHAEIDDDEVSYLFQNIRRRYETIPDHVKFEVCEDMQIISQRINEKYEVMIKAMNAL